MCLIYQYYRVLNTASTDKVKRFELDVGLLNSVFNTALRAFVTFMHRFEVIENRAKPGRHLLLFCTGQEADILAHMNRDHADAVALYARELLGVDGTGALLVGIDPEGCDIRVGSRALRLDFDRPIADAQEARSLLVELARDARQRPGTRGTD